jgi:hypothetical protein
LRELNREDLVPYHELRNELPMIMVNHAAYPDTPGGDRPASASPYWITTVLRKRIGYRGIIFSDDLEMGGILKFCPSKKRCDRRHPRGDGPAGDLPQPGADSARLYESLLREASGRSLPQPAANARQRGFDQAKSFSPAMPQRLFRQSSLKRCERAFCASAKQLRKLSLRRRQNRHERQIHDRCRHHERHFRRWNRCSRGAHYPGKLHPKLTLVAHEGFQFPARCAAPFSRR